MLMARERGLGGLEMVRGPAAPATASQARLLVVILNYNGIGDTLACLASLRHQTFVPSVLVIDNASRDDDLSPIASGFPDVEVIRLDRNLGWAGGNNVGLRLGLERGFQNICLLNNDTVLAPDAMAELLAAAEAVRSTMGAPGLLHPMIHDFDNASRAQLDPGPEPATPEPAARVLAARHDVVEFDWAYGACLLIPAALARRIGLLDERFFLQLEEQDYFHRAAAAGMRSYCARRSRVLHKESISFGGRVTPAKTYYQVRNTLLLSEKHHSMTAAWAALRRLVWALRHQASAARPRAASGFGFARWMLSADPLARAARHGVRDYLLRRFGQRRIAS